MYTEHVNSRKVTIYRTSSFAMDAQKERAPDFAAMASQYIGPYLMLNSKAVGSGLTEPEIRMLLPLLTDYIPTDKDFRQEVRKFFDALHTKVPYGAGIELEIGLTGDNKLPLSDKDDSMNMPIDVNEYVRYRHALGHPAVAKSREEAEGNTIKMFFISDPLLEQNKQHAINDVRDEALNIYLGLKADKDKVESYLTLMMEDPRKYATLKDQQAALRALVDKDPVAFQKVHKIDNFEDRFLIQKLINAGIFKIMNSTQVVDTEGNKIIGNDMAEAIMAMKKPDMETSILLWKGKMQELDRNKNKRRK